jgi:hypothetical protein
VLALLRVRYRVHSIWFFSDPLREDNVSVRLAKPNGWLHTGRIFVKAT